MIEHQWEIEEVNAGCLGPIDIWMCPVCGACGGDAFYSILRKEKAPKFTPFYADGLGAPLDLTSDCMESLYLIQEHLKARTVRA